MSDATAFRVSTEIVDEHGRAAKVSFIVRSGAGWKWAVEQAHQHLDGLNVIADVSVDEILPERASVPAEAEARR